MSEDVFRRHVTYMHLKGGHMGTDKKNEDKDLTQLDVLQTEIDKVRAVVTNLNYTDWEWDSYHVEGHEKDAVISGLEYYLEYLVKLKNKLFPGFPEVK